jgi:hypothetical protein
MFGSDILDLAIGVVFLFLLLSLICTAINELIEGFVKRRARDLERGLKELGAVAHEQRHDVALADAGLEEGGGKRVHPVEQLQVGEPGRAEEHRVLVRCAVRVTVEGPGEVVHDHLLRRLLGIERHSSE